MSRGNDGGSPQSARCCVARSLPRRSGTRRVGEFERRVFPEDFSRFCRELGCVTQFGKFLSLGRRRERDFYLSAMRARTCGENELSATHMRLLYIRHTRLGREAQNKLVAAIRHVRSRRPTSLPFSLISIGTVCLAGERTRLLRASHVPRSDLLALDVTTPTRTRKTALGNCVSIRPDLSPRNGRYRDKLLSQLTELASTAVKNSNTNYRGVCAR